MTMRRLLSVLAFSAVAFGCTQSRPDPTASRSEPPPPYTLERFRDEAKIFEGVDTLVFDNPYGEITVRQTSAGAVAWQGVEQRIGEQPRIARIEPFQEGKRQGVRIRYPGVNPDHPANPRLGRVDLYVFVPSGYKLDLKSDFGIISVRKLANDIRARSHTGMIVVANRGSFDLESATGEVRAFAMQGLNDSPSRLQTDGNIIVDVPVFDDILVDVRSKGEFRSDVPLDRKVTDAHGVIHASFSHGTQKHRLTVEGGRSVILQALNNPIPGGEDADD